MSQIDLNYLPISTKAAEGLQQLVHELQDVLGQQLVAAILYGEVVSPCSTSKLNETPLLLVLEDVTTDLLDKIATPIQKGIREYRLSVMILSEDELRRSTDVFPIKFLDIQRYHRLLCGKDVLQSLSVGRDHLRLRCEQEIKNLMLRLHQWYVLHATLPDQLERTLKHVAVSLLKDFAVMVELKTGFVFENRDQAQVLRASRELGLDVEPIRQVLALETSSPPKDAAAIKELYNQFMKSVHRAAEIVDAL